MNRRTFGLAAGGLVVSGVLAGPLPIARAQARRPVLKVRLAASLISGAKHEDVKAFTKTAVSLMTDPIGCDLDYDLAPVDRPLDLDALGRSIQRGEFHVGCVWGLEFGWLRKKYPKLELIASALSRDVETNLSLIYGRQGEVAALSQLQGKRLARYPKNSLMEELYVGRLLQSQGLKSKGFLIPTETIFRNAKSAITAVDGGKADCGVIDQITYMNLRLDSPKLIGRIAVIDKTESYPPPVMFANRETMEALRRGLWNEFSGAVMSLHTKPDGQEVLARWRLAKFIAPDPVIKTRIDEAVLKFPTPDYKRELCPSV